MERREELFWKKVNKNAPHGCWHWLNETCGKTHGSVNYKGWRTAPHRVSWFLNNGPIPDGMVVMHTCDHGICVNPAHLTLGTQTENIRDMWRKGRGKAPLLKGEAHGMARLTANKVIEIRRLYAQGNISQQALADQFGLGQSQIGRIIRGKAWKHLDNGSDFSGKRQDLAQYHNDRQ